MEPKATAATTIAVSLLSMSLTFKIVVLIIIIFMGANSYAIIALRAAERDKKTFTTYNYIQLVFVAMFSGSIFFLAAVLVSDSWIAAWISGGIGAVSGITGITSLSGIFIDGAREWMNKRLK